MDKAYGIGDFENIWSVEGLGHVYCQRVWKDKWNCSEDAHDIMMEGQAATDIPDKSLHDACTPGLASPLQESLDESN